MATVLGVGDAFATATKVTTVSSLGKNVNTLLKFAAKMLTSTSTVAGLALFFLGIFNLYTSHTKQASGGKPMSHGLVMLACGAALVALPELFTLMGGSILGGTNTIGASVSAILGK